MDCATADAALILIDMYSDAANTMQNTQVSPVSITGDFLEYVTWHAGLDVVEWQFENDCITIEIDTD